MIPSLNLAAIPVVSEAHAGALSAGLLQPPLLAYKQRTLTEPVHVQCAISSQTAGQSTGEHDQAFAEGTLAACLLLDQEVLDRLFILWNALEELACDEISDWTLRAHCSVSAASNQPAPVLLATAATVYANGEVAFALTVAEHASQLWFDDTLNLGDFLEGQPGVVEQTGQRDICEGVHAAKPAHDSTGG